MKEGRDFIIQINGNRKKKLFHSVCPTCNKDKGFIRKSRLGKECHSCNSIRQAEVGRTHNGKSEEVIINNRRVREKQVIFISDETKLKISKSNKETWIKKNGCKRSVDQSMIRSAFSKLLSRYIKRRSLAPRQCQSKFDLVGFTPTELFSHLQSLFKPGMTWENYGKWHIDHKKPDSLFSYNTVYDQEFKDCWSLNNLQPLWAKDNLSKGSKYVNA